MRWLGWALLLAFVAVAVVAAVVALKPEPEPSEKERMAAAVREFVEARNRMTPDEVRRSFGEPDEVFRNNPRALCWAYHAPYQIRMCWGPKRKSAWIGHNVPLNDDLYDLLDATRRG
jgi:hypothetical protein